jgi:hypothetical protein
VPLLQDEVDSQCVPIHALMLQERHRLPKIRACIDYWAQWLADMQATTAGIPKGFDSPAVMVTAYSPDPTRWDERFMKHRK